MAQKIDPEVTVDSFKGPMCLGHIYGLIPGVPLEVTIRAGHRKAGELNPIDWSQLASGLYRYLPLGGIFMARA